MAFAFVVLHLPPERFWALSLKEYQALIRAYQPMQPMNHTQLKSLMKEYPDTP